MGGICRVGRKLFAVAMAAVMSAGMWGCSGDVEWSNGFSKSAAQVIGFVDDSLVIVYDYQQWHRDLGSFIQDHGEESGLGHQRLRVFNYRVQEDGPRWADTLDNDDIEDFNYVRGQLSDSVIWGGDPRATMSFWKIGEKPYKMKIKKMFDGCSIDVRYTTKLRTWLDGKILVMGNVLNPDIDGFDLDSLGSEYCQYAVLDTIQKTVTYKRLEGDLKWIKKCDDVRAWGDDVYCLSVNEKNGFGLFVDNELKDLVLVDSVINISSLWLSFEFCFMGNMIYFGHNINSIDFEQEKIEIYPNMKATSALNFVDENGNNVNYDF